MSILCMGDSITAGAWLNPGEEWPALVACQIEEQIINRAVGGTCIAFTNGPNMAWADWAPLLTAQLRPATVIMAAGMNDLIRTDDTGLVTGAMARITKDIALLGSNIRWATITPLAQNSMWAAELNVRRLRILDWMRVNLADCLIDWEGELRDGTPWIDAAWDLGGSTPSHPNAIGQQRLADYALDTL